MSIRGFSPVAGIQWVETTKTGISGLDGLARFSPVAGIQWVETMIGNLYIV